MNQVNIQTAACVGRVCTFGARPDITFSTKETALFASLTPYKTAFANAATQQDGAKREFREQAEQHAVAAKLVRDMMRDIAEIAKSLAERGEDIGANEAFRMPPNCSYAKLATAAKAFVDLVEPRKALFTERGLPATFVEDLEAAITTLDSTGDQTGSKRARQVGGTKGQTVQVKRAMEIVRELRAILRVKFRDNPGLLAEWQALARVHEVPGANTEDQAIPPASTPAPAPTDGSSAPVPAS